MVGEQGESQSSTPPLHPSQFTAEPLHHHAGSGGGTPLLHVLLFPKASSKFRTTKQPLNSQTKNSPPQTPTLPINPCKHLLPIQGENPLPRNHGRRFRPSIGPKPVSPHRFPAFNPRHRHLSPIQRHPPKRFRQNLRHVPYNSDFRYQN